MLVSFICSLSGLIFIITLYAIYKSKLKFNNAKSKIYKYMLVVLFVLGLVIIISELMCQNGTNIKIADALMRAHWYGVIVLSIMFYFYIIAFISNLECKRVVDVVLTSKFTKISTLILGILLIISFFIPCTLRMDGKYNYIPGPLGMYIQVVMIFIVIMIFVYYVKFNKSGEKKLDRTVVFGLTLIFSIFLFFQFVVREVSFYGIAFISVMYFLYATSENPDLEMISTLKKINEEIIASSNAKTDIILNMSHDIRSPMNAIVNYSAELAEIKDLDKESIKLNIDNILVAGKNLLNILDDILEMSGKNQHVGVDIYNMNELVADLRNITESRIGNKPIKLELNVDTSLPQLLIGNAAKMYRILMNILSNSAKYTDVGKISLDVTGTKIDNDNIMLHIKVSDTGFGIKDEDKPKVFSEFVRLKDATNQKIEGTGLGIANTKKNVEVLGGKIWFDSTYGAGTTFYVDLPQKICVSKTLEEYNNEKEIGSKELIDCSNLTALIVDDNRVNTNITMRLLKRYGFKVDCAYNGNECINKVKNGTKYDIIFLDLMMNELSGEKVLNVLRYLNKQYDVPPIVALTANVLSGVREIYLKKGFDEYIAKPIDIKELDRVINLFFKGQKK
ncbi:MAG: ATP-binding protein [Bacilli bacterium]